MKKNILLICILAVCLSSCTSVASKKQNVLTAYMENTYLKYYIRPGKMISTAFKDDKAFVMIDFSYQKDNRNYVSDAYVNFTLNYAVDAYIETAGFLLPNNEQVMLHNPTTLDRNVNQGYIRISTLLKQADVQKVLENIAESSAFLILILENGEKKIFSVTADLSHRIKEAFAK